MDALFVLFGLYLWPYAKPLFLLLATGLLILFVWRRTKRPGARRAAAIGLPLLLFVDIIPSNAMLANLCANHSGLVVTDRAKEPISVALSDWASRGGFVFSELLRLFGALQIEVLEDRYFQGAESPSLEAGFYQLTAVENTDPDCHDDWNLLSDLIPEYICVQTDKIDGFTASHLIDRESWKRLGIEAVEISIIDRQTGDALGTASQYTRRTGYSWSGMSAFFASGPAGSVQKCPGSFGPDIYGDLLEDVVFVER